MDLSGNTILITGGASGIGWTLTERFLAAGNEVIICGRREDRLLEAQKKYQREYRRKWRANRTPKQIDAERARQREYDRRRR